MKKMYEGPIFEITSFSFEEMLDDGYVNPSELAGTRGIEGGDVEF